MLIDPSESGILVRCVRCSWEEWFLPGALMSANRVAAAHNARCPRRRMPNSARDRRDAAILGIVQTAEQPLPSSAVHAALGESWRGQTRLKEVRRALLRLVEHGDVVEVGSGRGKRWMAAGRTLTMESVVVRIVSESSVPLAWCDIVAGLEERGLEWTTKSLANRLKSLTDEGGPLVASGPPNRWRRYGVRR